MNLILFGFKGAGKSTFAKKLNLPYIDTDVLLGLSPKEIVLRKGNTYFQQIEENWIAHLELVGHVIAVGGSTVLNPNNVKKLQSLGTLVYLKCPKYILKKRILTSPFPTFIDKNHPEESFEKMYSQRIPQYEKIPSKVIDLENKTDDEVIKELWQVINLESNFALSLGENHMGKQ